MQVWVNLEAVERFMKQKKLTRCGLAIKLGMTPSSIYRIFNGERKAGGKFQRGLISIGMNPNDIFLSSNSPNGENKR